MLKIGILGATEIAKDHIRILLELKNQFTIIGFYDPYDNLADEIIESFSIERFYNYEDLLDQVDCIDIVSPTIKHFEFASIALRKSKHIFIEKPLTQTIDEAKSLMSLSREASVKVQIGSTERFNSAFLKSLEFIKRPMFIETHRLHQFNSQLSDVSVVLDLMINDIDVILSIVKSSVRKVVASGAIVFSDTYDIVNARIEFDNGCVACLTASRISNQKKCESLIFQKGSIVNVNFLLDELEIVSSNDRIFDSPKKIISERPIFKVSNPKLEEFKSLYDSIINDFEPIVSLTNGYDSLSVALKIIDILNQ